MCSQSMTLDKAKSDRERGHDVGFSIPNDLVEVTAGGGGVSNHQPDDLLGVNDEDSADLHDRDRWRVREGKRSLSDALKLTCVVNWHLVKLRSMIERQKPHPRVRLQRLQPGQCGEEVTLNPFKFSPHIGLA